MGSADLEGLVRTEMKKRYLVTSAQHEASINKALYENMQLYAEKNDAEIVILPMRGKSVKDEWLHPDISAHPGVVTKEMKINDSLKISNYEIRPQQINPLTGLKRFAQGDKSFIFASPKQHLEYVANSYDDIPKAIMTTGALTNPRYNENVRTGRIAKKDHTYGFINVEVESNKFFHFRHIRSQKNGVFWDIDGEYRNGKFKSLKNVPALVVGDLHPYDTDPVHEANTFEQIKHFKPKHVFLHDTFNGTSISHHYKGHNIEYFRQSKGQGLDLDEELKHTAGVIESYLNVLPKGSKLHVVASNHDEHLYRYLDEGRFIGDKGNDLVASKLYTAALQGENPLKAGIEMYMDIPKNLNFIERDEGFSILGYQMGHHGDLGANGGRGSKRSLQAANGKSFTGHTHSAFLYDGLVGVGTSTFPRIGYNKGYSNWTQTNGVLYSNGQPGLINTIKNKWK